MSEHPTIQAVMIDMVSIQSYIFASNKLKENIGAEYLVKDSYRGPLQTVIDDMYPIPDAEKTFDRKRWRVKPADMFIQHPNFDIAYVGGGNALLLFKEANAETAQEKAKAFIRKWTTRLLLEAPGITTAVAYQETIEAKLGNNFQDVQHALERSLAANRAQSIPQTTLPRHGITAECSRSGLSMETIAMVDDKDRYVSSMSAAKLAAVPKAQDMLLEEFRPILGQDYTFTDEIDKLGQKEGEDSHIAIVHIDGNDMSLQFQGQKSLEAFRQFSDSVETATNKTFQELIALIVKNYEPIMAFLGWDPKKNHVPTDEDGKRILPIRSIVRGGDDITFVCDGRLGIYLAKRCLEFFEKKQRSRALTACAGIAITKTKYPFYRGYDLSEQLCSSAKKFRKTSVESTSYLDFHLSMGAISGSLEAIRHKYFQAAQGSLLFRPYRIGGQGKGDGRNMDGFLKAVNVLRDTDTFPRNKVQELRQILPLSKAATEQFVRELAFRGRKLPQIEGGDYHKWLFDHEQTPYFDMIELLEYYPDATWETTGQNTGGNET